MRVAVNVAFGVVHGGQLVALTHPADLLKGCRAIGVDHGAAGERDFADDGQDGVFGGVWDDPGDDSSLALYDAEDGRLSLASEVLRLVRVRSAEVSLIHLHRAESLPESPMSLRTCFIMRHAVL